MKNSSPQPPPPPPPPEKEDDLWDVQMAEVSSEPKKGKTLLMTTETGTPSGVDVATDSTGCQKLLYAFLYALFSFLMMCVNKVVLTSYKFPAPSVLVVGQILVTIFLLKLAKMAGYIRMQECTWDTIWTMHPVPALYLLNAVTGLGSTKELSLPMFTALRRFVVLITMVGQYFLLGTKTGLGIQLSIYVMIGGAIVAALNDLTFSFWGYFLVILNNFLTSAYDIATKQKLVGTTYSPYEILYYNGLIVLSPSIIIAVVTGEVDQACNYGDWTEPIFMLNFILSCVMGFLLLWSLVQCTNYNSALTTSVVGTIKNIFVTYIGMFIGNDYVYDPLNMLGINISVVGSFMYTGAVFHTFQQQKK